MIPAVFSKSFALIAFLVLPLAVGANDAGNQEKVERTVGRFQRAWSEADAVKRGECLAEVWAEDGTYRDPSTSVRELRRYRLIWENSKLISPPHKSPATAGSTFMGPPIAFCGE